MRPGSFKIREQQKASQTRGAYILEFEEYILYARHCNDLTVISMLSETYCTLVQLPTNSDIAVAFVSLKSGHHRGTV